MNYGRRGIKARQAALNARGPKWSRKFLLIFIEAACIAILAVGVMCAALGIGLFKGILSSAPDISKINVTPTKLASFVYDAEGNEIGKLVAESSNRIIISSEDIPQDMKDAFVALEDERFYQHNGIDIQSIIRAAVYAVQHGRMGQGGSTITQQLIKNNVFEGWATEKNNMEKIRRKIQEQYLAVQLEKTTDKDAILTTYLNTINCGQNTLGVQAASLRYFGKDCKDLTLSECAVIAPITQAPTKYNPIIHPDNNRSRAEETLNKMLKQGYITQEEYDEAWNDDVYSRIQTNNELKSEQSSVNSYFVDAVTEKLEEDLLALGYTEDQTYALMYSGGLRIQSTMDPEIQRICDEEFANPENYFGIDKWYLDYRLTIQKADGTIQNHSSEMFRTYFRQNRSASFNMLYTSQEDAYADCETYQDAVMEEGDEIVGEPFIHLTIQPQISFTVADQATGQIKAMIGGRGEKEGNRTLNRATQSMRQPGSCFKVLAAFGPAIDAKGMSLATVFNDAPFNYIDGTPVANWYKDGYRGLQSIRKGIEQSLNIVAVKTITQITPALGFNYLQNLGFTTLEEAKPIGDRIFTDIGQPLALGGITNGVKNFELNAAYACIANQGVYIEPTLYTTVMDADGNVLIDNTNPDSRRVFSEQTSFLLTSAMTDCVRFGTGTNARFAGMSIAGKTGTTSDERDVWFAGFTPYYTATCWVGFDNNEVMNSKEQRAVQVMFSKVMSRVHEDLTDPGFPVPEGIVRVPVCSQSGKLPTPGLCDACIVSEYFTPDSVPTEYCDVHIQGQICAFDNLRACPGCPFAYEGVTTTLPPEDPSLWQGSNVLATELDPLGAGAQNAANNGFCHHNEQFFMQEGWEGRVEAERAELDARNAAAQAAWEAAQAAAAGQ